MNKEEFYIEIKKLGININDDQKKKLNMFYKILIEENKKINLTRIIEEREVYLKHFYDSLTIIKEVDLEKAKTLCDVGTGAGFPGIVLKIIYPNIDITLIDSLQKRVNYLNETIEKLELKKIKAIHIRAEEYNQKFDIVTSRAVARLDKLINWCMHLTKKEGIFIAMKANIDEELIDINKTLNKNKCEIKTINKFSLPKEESKRALVVIKNQI